LLVPVLLQQLLLRLRVCCQSLELRLQLLQASHAMEQHVLVCPCCC
jgi:hypothetical protein